MSRSPSGIAQYTFDATHRLLYLSFHSTFLVRLLARTANRVIGPLAKRFGKNHTVSARLYGRFLTVPAEHPLAGILVTLPQYNCPLGLAIQAIASLSSRGSSLAIVDVGANVGDTMALIEERCPDLCTYLCVEADQEIAQLCASNYAGNSRVHVENCYIGEDEGAAVTLQDDGRANPSVKLVAGGSEKRSSGSGQLVRLDTIAGPFAETQGAISLIKIDTEGYDFSVLRSAPKMLDKYKPAIYFEWYPKLIADLGEEVWDGFEYLASFGYRHFIFFTSRGDLYCQISEPDHLCLHSLSGIALNDEDIGYFDVFASTEEAVCKQLVEHSITALGDPKMAKKGRRFAI